MGSCPTEPALPVEALLPGDLPGVPPLAPPPRNCPYQCSQPTSTNAIFDAEEACAMLRIGRGAMYQLAKDHDDPFPIKFSRAPRLESSLTFHALE